MGRAAPGGWRRAPSFSKAPESRVSLRCGFPKIRYPPGGPYNKDYSILGFIFGSPCFGKLPCRVQGLEFCSLYRILEVYRTCVYMWKFMKLRDNVEPVLGSTLG